MNQPPAMNQPPSLSQPPATNQPPSISQPPTMMGQQPLFMNHTPPQQQLPQQRTISQPPPAMQGLSNGPPTSLTQPPTAPPTAVLKSNGGRRGRYPSQPMNQPPMSQPPMQQQQPPPPQMQQHRQLPSQQQQQHPRGIVPPNGQYQQQPPQQQYQQQQPPQQQQYQQQPPQQQGLPTDQQQYSQMQPTQPGRMPGRPQQRGVDPETVPNPVGVHENDALLHKSGTFSMQSRSNPPLTATNAIISDDGSASCRAVRSTLNIVPTTKELLSLSKIPLALVVSPLSEPMQNELPVPTANLQNNSPIRCRRCKSYICCASVFVDGGRAWTCAFCKTSNPVPDWYFDNLDASGYRKDIQLRPELHRGTVEYLAPASYCARPPQIPATMFLIDVSRYAVTSGMTETACHAIRQVIEAHTRKYAQQRRPFRMGIITYDTSIHFYNISASLSQPQMVVMSDIGDVFVPLQVGLIVDAVEAKKVIFQLLDDIPKRFANTNVVDQAYGSAIRAAVMSIKEYGGRVLSMFSSLPLVGMGSLKKRDDQSLLGTDKEYTLLRGVEKYYDMTAADCVKYGVCVDLFIAANMYVDVASLALLSRRTNGSIQKYEYFRGGLHGKKLISDVVRTVMNSAGCEAMMRVRTSTGIRATDFFGAISMDNTNDVELAGVDSKQTVVVRLKFDDKLNPSEEAHFQVAILYTNMMGERRIRVHTNSYRTTSQLAELFRGADIDAVTSVLPKLCVDDVLKGSLTKIRSRLTSTVVGILACYRKHCTSTKTPAGQLILPEGLKLLPLYANCLLRSLAFKFGKDVSPDDRVYNLHFVLTQPPDALLAYLYPRMIEMHLAVTKKTFPQGIRPSSRYIKDHGIYLIENGLSMWVWVGHLVPSSTITDIFGADCYENINASITSLTRYDNESSQRFNDIVDELRRQRGVDMPFQLVKQKEPNVIYFNKLLVEDKYNDLTSYVDYLCYVHREVQQANSS
eukprot:m.45719 g.45719  ORF g.45719 m.45719 type:complete len:969 (+) comp7234_c0_seq1:3-2909(+)